MATSYAKRQKQNLLKRIRYYEKQGYIFNVAELAGLSPRRQANLKGHKLTNLADAYRLPNNDVISISALKEYQYARTKYNAFARATSTRAELFSRLPFTTSKTNFYKVLDFLQTRANVGYFQNRANVLVENYLRTLAFIPDQETANALYFHIASLPDSVVVKKILNLNKQGAYGIQAGVAFDSLSGLGVADISGVLRYWGLDPDFYNTEAPWEDYEVENYEF